MEEFKKPTSLLAGTNIIFSVGSFMYLYKKFEQLQKDNDEMKKNLAILTTKVAKNNNEDLQTEELLRMMHKDVKMLKNNVDRIEEEELKAVIKTLENNGINVNLPVKNTKKDKYKKQKKYKLSLSEE